MKCLSVSCPTCKGSGKTKLPPAFQATLDQVGKDWISTADIYGKLPDKEWILITGLNNRLITLANHGLVEYQVRGKAKFWRRK